MVPVAVGVSVNVTTLWRLKAGSFAGVIPSVGQLPVRRDGEHLAVQNAAPVAAQVEAVADGRLEIVFHQPLLDQMRLGQRTPQFFRRMRHLALDDDGTRLGHWSILFSKSSRASNRSCQNPVIRLVQSIKGASARTCAL